MDINLSFSSIAALFGIMLVGALIPGVSVLAVSARSAASGFMHGVFTTLGIVVGDIIFILIAIFGLAFLADAMGDLFIYIKYLGAAYLTWLGVALWRSKSNAVEAYGTESVVDSSLLSSFMTGLLITLGDQKAILFYLGFFPAFIDLSVLSYFDAGIIVMIAIVAVGGVKLAYAYMAERASLFLKRSGAIKKINMAAGTVMIGVGMFLVAKA